MNACHCERHPHAKGTIVARAEDILLPDPFCRFHGDMT